MLTLPSQLVARLLADPTFKPEQRPPRFELGAGAFVFRECAQPDGQPAKRRPPGSDRWRNTGGVKGARLLELESGSSVKLLRRYGTLQLATGAGVPARGRRAGASTAGKEGGKGKVRHDGLAAGAPFRPSQLHADRSSACPPARLCCQSSAITSTTWWTGALERWIRPASQM
eukprot:SAG31_NODE_3038_length_4759_cov_2.556438_1_plen_172_part_00